MSHGINLKLHKILLLYSNAHTTLGTVVQSCGRLCADHKSLPEFAACDLLIFTPPLTLKPRICETTPCSCRCEHKSHFLSSLSTVIQKYAKSAQLRELSFVGAKLTSSEMLSVQCIIHYQFLVGVCHSLHHPDTKHLSCIILQTLQSTYKCWPCFDLT